MPVSVARLVLASLLILVAAGTLRAQIRYDAVAPAHLAKVSTSPCVLDKTLKALPTEVLASPAGTWTAVVAQTDPVTVPYDRARGCIKISGQAGNRFVAVGGFRALHLTWVNERLLYIFTDVGHTAGVGQLLDVDDAKWMYAKTELYVDTAQTGPPAPRQPDAVVIQAARRSIVQDIDPKLPKTPLETWLRSVVGTQPTMKWGVTDCGEQSGNPAVDRGRDFPMCAEVMVSLSETRELVLEIAMGTFNKGLTGGKPVLFTGVLKTGDKMQWIKTLSEVPTLLVGRYEP